jgi:hypothetical protein
LVLLFVVATVLVAIVVIVTSVVLAATAVMAVIVVAVVAVVDADVIVAIDNYDYCCIVCSMVACHHSDDISAVASYVIVLL